MSTKLNHLRERIATLERGGATAAAPPVPTGVPALDAALPGGGLARGALHEIMSPDPADGAAAGFLVHLLTRLEGGAVLWASCREDLYAPGLTAAGFDPARLLLVHAPDGQSVLWSLEEGLRAKGLAAVVGEVGDIDFALTRRLQLAAADSGLPLFLLRPWRRKLLASAAATRWRVRSDAFPGKNETGIHAKMIERARWQVALLRCRGGRPQSWLLEMEDETRTLAVAAAPDHRPDRSQAA